ncbi:hypothetical protein [Halomontanus rarus]|uniref:hypothetical protein n=1 Tax=Halomontanus rarus TaxID=3034020 RepID=UPI00293BF9C2|nr:hypothetical protein [Halovivax sp. KZCA124]
MPFIAERDDELVIPEAVDDGEDLMCTECQGVMRSRGPFKDGTARHFYHLAATDCSGGESDIHRKWKSLAVSALRQRFSEELSYCAPEATLECEWTLTVADSRRADALVAFSEANPFFGEGVIIEVQWKNEGKDVAAATHDYLALGYSVYWADENDFELDRFLIDNMLTAFNNRSDDAFAPYYANPPSGLEESSAEGGLLNYILTHDPDCVVSYSNPFPDRDHDWINRSGWICHRCGLHRYEQSHLEQPMYLYDSEDTEPRELDRIERGFRPTDHSHEWIARRSGSEGEQLDCECSAKRTHKDNSVIIDHGPNATWDITISIPSDETEHSERF